MLPLASAGGSALQDQLMTAEQQEVRRVAGVRLSFHAND
jgi:hypothetical protein